MRGDVSMAQAFLFLQHLIYVSLMGTKNFCRRVLSGDAKFSIKESYFTY